MPELWYFISNMNEVDVNSNSEKIPQNNTVECFLYSNSLKRISNFAEEAKNHYIQVSPQLNISRKSLYQEEISTSISEIEKNYKLYAQIAEELKEGRVVEIVPFGPSAALMMNTPSHESYILFEPRAKDWSLGSNLTERDIDRLIKTMLPDTVPGVEHERAKKIKNNLESGKTVSLKFYK